MNVDILHQILDIIEQHGLSVVLLLLMVAAWVITVTWISKKFDQLWLTFIRSSPERKESIESIVILNTKIKSCLRDIMTDIGSDWCQLWQFHNGTHGIGKTRIPFMFLTMTHEVCKDDCGQMRQTFTQLPLSMFDKFAQDLITEDLLVYKHEEESVIEALVPIGKVLLDFGARVGLVRTIRDDDGKIIGFMTSVWKHNGIPSDRQKTSFLNGSQRMAIVLASLPDEDKKEI